MQTMCYITDVNKLLDESSLRLPHVRLSDTPATGTYDQLLGSLVVYPHVRFQHVKMEGRRQQLPVSLPVFATGDQKTATWRQKIPENIPT